MLNIFFETDYSLCILCTYTYIIIGEISHTIYFENANNVNLEVNVKILFPDLETIFQKWGKLLKNTGDYDQHFLEFLYEELLEYKEKKERILKLIRNQNIL